MISLFNSEFLDDKLQYIFNDGNLFTNYLSRGKKRNDLNKIKNGMGGGGT